MQNSNLNFQKKKFVSPKNGGHLEFLNFFLKTVRDRAISMKFFTHRVSVQSIKPNFQNFCLAKNGGHFEFSNFSQKLQNTKMLVS